MNAAIGEQITHGPYSLVMGLLDGSLMIRRQDDDRKRTVAHIDSTEQWDRFVAALEAGSDEIAAVHAIDEAHGARP